MQAIKMAAVINYDAFEAERRQRIAANRLKLIELDVSRAAAHLAEHSKPTRRQVERSEAKAVPTAPTRSSRRLQAKTNGTEPGGQHALEGFQELKQLPKVVKKRLLEQKLDATVYTQHNLMRLSYMDVTAQERRIAKITNINKMADLIEVYATGGQQRLSELARERLAELQGS